MDLSDDQKQNASLALGTCVIAGGAVVGATQTSHTGPILAFVGAILVALITAYTSERRQKAALQAEDQRHRATLEADAARQDRQLRHDRELSDLADMRQVLEEALDALDARHDGAAKILVGDESGGIRNLEAMDFYSRATNRLQIRLGDDDPILRAYAAAGDAFDELVDAAHAEDEAAFKQQVEDAGRCYRGFVESAKTRFGSAI